MLSLSITTGYAIKALRCLENEDCRSHLIKNIAECAGVPRPYLAKIINSLSQNGLVSTKRGYHGGISLARPAASISLLDIVVAVEGEHWIGDCLLGLDDCQKPNECPTLEFWSRIRKEIEQELARWTLADLIKSRHGTANDAPDCCGCDLSPQVPIPPASFAFSI
jgi:Rrf2 family iron-sulfur cluster assembly transcriptional regulator